MIDQLAEMPVADKAADFLTSIVEDHGPAVKESILLKAGNMKANLEETEQSAEAKAQKAPSLWMERQLEKMNDKMIEKLAQMPDAGEAGDLLKSFVEAHGPAVKESILLKLAETMEANLK